MQRKAVGQTGEHVMMCEVGNLGLALSHLGDVAVNGDEAPIRQGLATHVDDPTVGSHALEAVRLWIARALSQHADDLFRITVTIFTAPRVEL